MRRLICVYVVHIWQNDNRSFRRTQVISYASHFVPFWLFRIHLYFQFSHFVPSLVTSGTRFVSTFTWNRVVSPLSLSPWVVSSESFRLFFRSPCVVSPTFPFASRVVSPPYKFCFGLLIGVKLVLFEILSYINNEQWTVSLMYIYIFNLGIDKGEITYMIYLEELTYIYLFI